MATLPNKNPGGRPQAGIASTQDNRLVTGNPVYRSPGGGRGDGRGWDQNLPMLEDNRLGGGNYLPMPPRQNPEGQREY